MNPTSKKTMTPEELDLALNAFLLKIEGENSSDSRTEKTQEKNRQAKSGSSGSVSTPATPRLTSGTKSPEKAALAFDGSKVNGDPHTPPIKRAKLERKNAIKEKVIQRQIKSSDGEGSSSSTTPRSVRFTTSDATTPVSKRSAAHTQTPMPTPVATPRTAGVAKDDSSSGSSGRGGPSSPRPKELVKKISKGVSKAALTISKLKEKISNQVASLSTSTLATPKSSGRNSPKNSSPQKEDVLSFLTIKEKNDIVIAMNKFEAGIDAALSPARKKMLLHAKLMELLPDRSKLKELSVLDVLMADVEKRYSVAFINKEIDLGDPQYLDLVNRVVDGAFIKTWDRDNATFDDSELKKYLQFVQPSFARDFSHSNYEIKNSDGSIKKLNSIVEFVEFIGPGSEGNLPRIVSNIASQNLGMFFKPVLFYREQKGGIPESILHLDDGTPIRPNVTFRQKYTFSKNSDGKIIIDYESNASKEFQIGKPMMAAKNNGGPAIVLNDATIKIKVLIEVNPDGRWYINNPHVVAENWNNVVS
jgi:hypothetical protein